MMSGSNRQLAEDVRGRYPSGDNPFASYVASLVPAARLLPLALEPESVSDLRHSSVLVELCSFRR